MIADRLAQRVEAAANAFNACSIAFKTLEDRARDLQANGYFGAATVPITAEAVPGFEIDFGFAQLRFSWEPVIDDRNLGGQIVLLKSFVDDRLQRKWTRVTELKFDRKGFVDEKQLPQGADPLALSDGANNYTILMNLVLLGLTGKTYWAENP